MRVLAWTNDFVLTPFKGFSLHGMFTLRSPKYSRYYFKPTFSDGFSEEFDFSGKQITESSAIEIELEPSYTIGHWMLWASARYYSKQYVNITIHCFSGQDGRHLQAFSRHLSRKIFCLSGITLPQALI